MPQAPRKQPFLASLTLRHVAAIVLTAVAVASLALAYGFRNPPVPAGVLVGVQLAVVSIYALWRVSGVLRSPNRRAALRTLWPDFALLLMAAGFLFFRFELSTRPVLHVSTLYVVTMQALLVARLILEGARVNLLLSHSHLHPTRLVAITFVCLIVLGGLALSLPVATHPHVTQHPDYSSSGHVLNSFFTATSATCVTGLVVYDTGSDYTLFGQIVILVLIQAGGLGIMIFGSVFGLLAGRELSLRQSLVLQDAMSYRTVGDMRRMIIFIVVATLLAELVGAAILYPMWEGLNTWQERVFHSIFHAVSAFCNAGFGLEADSLVSYRTAWQVYGGIVPLILLGGLGFPVLYDLWRRVRVTAERWRHAGKHRGARRISRHRFTLHTKLVLVTTLVLLVVPTIALPVINTLTEARQGAVAFVSPTAKAMGHPVASPTAKAMGHAVPTAKVMGHASEAGCPTSLAVGDTIEKPGVFDQGLDAFFFSVTCRTAGFNTIPMDVESMTPGGHFLGCLLMFVGGSPASTAGGVKTLALVVLVLGAWTLLRGRTNVEAMGRTIAQADVRRAAVVVIIMFALVSLVTLTLLVTETATMREVLFEATSACGTVGLSTGLTSRLTSIGRVVMMVAMLAGRLGPLTVLIALAGGAHAARYEYPVERVAIG